MIGLITDKLTQYPNLVQQINERGGLEFLQKSTHTMGSGRWSSKNPKNMFMNSLIQAYKNTSQVVDSGIDTNRKIEIPYFRTNRKKGDVEILPNSEGYFAESQFGKGYYISLDKPYIDHSYFEGKVS